MQHDASNSPRESVGVCFYGRWFVCVCLSVCLPGFNSKSRLNFLKIISLYIFKNF